MGTGAEAAYTGLILLSQFRDVGVGGSSLRGLVPSTSRTLVFFM